MGAAAAQKRSWDGAEEEDGGGDERGGCWWCLSRGGGPYHLLRVCGACRTRESHANAAPSCRIPINAKRTEEVLKPFSLNVLLLKLTTTGSFLICVSFVSLLIMNAKARWSELGQRSSQPLGPGVCGCTCTPPCWHGVGHVTASPRSSR